MPRYGLATFAIIFALVFFFAFPSPPSNSLKLQASTILVRAGVPSIGALLLEGPAEAGHPIALNNLGVLLFRGVGVRKDPARAAKLLNDAEKAGLQRASLNLLIARASCSVSSPPIKDFAELMRAGDIRAASFLGDCAGRNVGFGRSWADDYLLEASGVAVGSGSQSEKLKFAWLLADLAPLAQRRDEFATLAAKYLFELLDEGRIEPYDKIAILAEKLSDRITDPVLRKRVMVMSPQEWLWAGAKAGHPNSACRYGATTAFDVRRMPALRTKELLTRYKHAVRLCSKNRDPNNQILVNGEFRSQGKDPHDDVWAYDEAFLVHPPAYQSYWVNAADRGTGSAVMLDVLSGRWGRS